MNFGATFVVSRWALLACMLSTLCVPLPLIVQAVEALRWADPGVEIACGTPCCCAATVDSGRDDLDQDRSARGSRPAEVQLIGDCTCAPGGRGGVTLTVFEPIVPCAASRAFEGELSGRRALLPDPTGDPDSRDEEPEPPPPRRVA